PWVAVVERGMAQMLVTTNYHVNPRSSRENRGMDIRKATATDRDAVIALWEATDLTRAWNDPVADFDRALTGAASTILVGEEAGALIAAVMVGHDGHRGWVYYLAVHPGEQGHGAVAALMRASEAWLVDHGIEVIRLMVRDTNGHV